MAGVVGKAGVAFSRLWHVTDARGQVLGRLARGIATTLMGQHKPVFDPSNDCGDHVVVVNAKQIVVSGDKLQTKMYRHHSGFPGGMKERSLEELLRYQPEEAIKKAVYGMLPKNKLRPLRMQRLHVFANDKHPYGDNLAKSYEHSELADICRREWSEKSGLEIKQMYESQLRNKLLELTKKEA